MANHAHVEAASPIDPQLIADVIARLNAELFKGLLSVEYHRATKDEPGWGEHTWLLSMEFDGIAWVSRVCWLDDNHFQMRHGGGSNFAWWVDRVITNEVAVETGGDYWDDATCEKEKGVPGIFRTFEAYLKESYSYKTNDEIRRFCVSDSLEFTPPQFKFPIENVERW